MEPVGLPDTFPEASTYRFLLTHTSHVVHVVYEQPPLTRTLCGQVRQLLWRQLPRQRPDPDHAAVCRACTLVYNTLAQQQAVSRG